ncbi:hypothetical protein AB0J90_18470 [Micromonospora sp. NPDC049523]|uniref:hypothetical protein n=1 Tax=Micromonospora sp. NPDC049523 TaxID=3155921 RepID=UPI00341C4E92
MRTLTLKAGGLGRSWHAAHILLSIVTGGWWLPVYGIHAIVSSMNRPTVHLQVPDGHRVEYRDGWPNVLGPDEYLKPRTARDKALIFVGYASPILIAAAILAGVAIRT